MFDEEIDPKKKKPGPKPLDIMSVKELEDYIGDLKAEITRVEGEISKKNAHKNAASAFFKE